MPRDRILLDALEVPCVVGIYPAERTREQPLLVDVALELDLRAAARTGDLRRSCDYAWVARELAAALRFRRYLLLEVAAEELAALLLAAHPEVAAVSLTIRKPEALPGLARAAAVAVGRDRSDLPAGPGGGDDERDGSTLLTTADGRLRRWTIAPGRALALDLGGDAALLWVITGALECGDATLAGGGSLYCPEGHVLKTMNQGTSSAIALTLERRAHPAEPGPGAPA